MRALRSLRGQLAVAFALVLLLAGGAAGLAQYRQVRRVLHEADDTRLQARAQLLLEQVDLSGSLPVLPLPAHGEVGRVVLETAGQPARELFRSPGPGAAPANLRGITVSRAYTDYAGRRAVVRLSLAHPAAPLAADLRRVQLGLWAALAGSLALAAALAALLGRWVLQPLRRMSEQAGCIGAVPGSERLPVPATGDEMQELARTLNQMLDRLQAGAELQDNFLAAAAHELRTPLATLHTGLAVLRQSPELPAALRPALAAQQQELERLGRLVEDFLLVSRLRSDDALPLPRRPVALDELALAAADQLLPRFQAAHRPLTIAVDEAVPDYTVLADADKLSTVLLNLLDNALRHAPPHSPVQLTVGEEAGGLRFAEVSNPLRASLGDLSRLTAARYQADVLSGGAGLGLWLSNRIAELHGHPLVLREEDGRLFVRVRLAGSPSVLTPPPGPLPFGRGGATAALS